MNICRQRCTLKASIYFPVAVNFRLNVKILALIRKYVLDVVPLPTTTCTLQTTQYNLTTSLKQTQQTKTNRFCYKQQSTDRHLIITKDGLKNVPESFFTVFTTKKEIKSWHTEPTED